MKGYVKNVSHLWAHAMKRAVGPGAQISLEELYEQYGKKYNLKPGDEFIYWLKEVKLRDNEKWQILDENGNPYVFSLNKEKDFHVDLQVQESKDQVESVSEDKSSVNKSRGDNVTPIVSKELSIDEIVTWSVRKAREVLPKITDIILLKYALNQANTMSGKDSLCRLLRKRIQELEISSRR